MWTKEQFKGMGEKLRAFLLGGPSEAEEEKRPEEAGPPDTQAAPGEQDFLREDPALVKLEREHPLMTIYDHRRKTAGSLPAPRLCLDENGQLPEEVLEREKRRLQSMLKTASTQRLKETDYGAGSRHKSRGRGKGGEEDVEAIPEDLPQALDAWPWFFLSNDKLYAWVLVFPPEGGGQELSRDLLLRAMGEQDIGFGVDERLVDRLSHDDRRYFNLFLLARGKPAFDGKNGNVVDYFPRVIDRILEVDEYDQVDYTALNLIHNVREGQEICRLIRPTEGEPGMTVQGKEIEAKSGKFVPLPKGRNTEVSEDGEVLLAAISGHVEFSGNTFQVRPVMEIAGNVDFSTGNIKFVGDVSVKGDVLAGFSVKAMGNIWVGGVLESGCSVEAGGDLTVVKGILGDGSTVVRAQRCIFAKYIENATLAVRENLQTDAIINGEVYCDGEVVVRSGRGSIVGGHVWAGGRISANAVGSHSESRTDVTLGGQPCASYEKRMAQHEYRVLAQEIEKLEAALDNPIKVSLLKKARMKMTTVELRLQQLEEELAGDGDDAPKKKAPREQKDAGEKQDAKDGQNAKGRQDPKEKKNTKNKKKEKSGEEGKDAGEDQEQEGKEKRKKKPAAPRMECGVVYAGTDIHIEREVYRVHRETRQCTAKMYNGEIVLM